MLHFLSSLFRRGPYREEADLRIQLATLKARNEDLREQLDEARSELHHERQTHLLEVKRFTNWYVGAAVFEDAGAPEPAPDQDLSPVVHSTRRASVHQARKRFERDLSGAELNIGLAHPLTRTAMSRQAAEQLEAEKKKLTEETTQ